MKFYEHALNADGQSEREEMGDVIGTPERYEFKITTFVDRYIFYHQDTSGEAAPFHQLSNVFPLRING